MKSTNRKRALLVSASVILLCMTIIVGMTWALFTDTQKVTNHLQAGDLSITLKRAHDVITLAVLKEKGLISSKVGRMKVLADGMLNKPLTIKSESYSIQAIKMIELTGGTVIILRD